MALDNSQLDRLKAQLLTSGLNDKNQPLFQVISQLIDSVRLLQNDVNATDAAAEALPTQVYTVTNVATDRTYDASATAVAELANVLGTLISDLRARGIVK